MTLKEKLDNIDKIKLKKLEYSKYKTIKEFYNSFIVNLLPSKESVIGIYNLLLTYIEDKENKDNIYYVIRYFSNTKGGKHNFKSIRNGFLTISNDFNYVFSDNSFAHFFFKLALDNYIPKYNEFKEMMNKRLFPLDFGKPLKEVETKSAFILDAKDPLFYKSGYRLSHIFSVGVKYNTFFNHNEEVMDIHEWLKRINITRGEYEDFIYDSNLNTYVRYIDNKDVLKDEEDIKEANEILKAHFLRFLAPFNILLTPTYLDHICLTKVDNNDIGECKELLMYAFYKNIERYDSIYLDYLKRIRVSKNDFLNNLLPLNELEDFVIDIYIGKGIGEIKESNKIIYNEPLKLKRINNNFINGNNKDTNIKINLLAKELISYLLNNDLLSNDLINHLKDKKYSKKHLKCDYPVLIDIKDINNNINNYNKSLYYRNIYKNTYKICSSWDETSRSYLIKWFYKYILLVDYNKNK